MKKYRQTLIVGLLAVSASLLATGCISGSQATNPDSIDENAGKPTTENSGLENLKYTDISAQEAETAKPLNLMGGGPMAHADTGMLSALKRSYIEHGTPLMASQLELSYDFKSGDFKGDPLLLSQKSSGLEKAASTAAWDGIFRYQGYYHGGWQGWVGNGEWIGNPNGSYNLDELSGWNIQTTVVNGVTPSIYWNMYWGGHNGGYGWTSTYSWNQWGQTNSYWWRGFKADTRTAGYSICYEMKFSTSSTWSDIWACGGTAIFQNMMTAVAMKFTIITK